MLLDLFASYFASPYSSVIAHNHLCANPNSPRPTSIEHLLKPIGRRGDAPQEILAGCEGSNCMLAIFPDKFRGYMPEILAGFE
jgi:hypothetical protein